MEKVQFINSYSFIFSPRPGTPAGEMEMINTKLAKKDLQFFRKYQKIKLKYKKNF